jgi:hypothetical protein
MLLYLNSFFSYTVNLASYDLANISDKKETFVSYKVYLEAK